MIKRFFLLSLVFALTGCSGIVKTKIKEVPVYKVEYIFLSVPDHILKINDIPVPPKKEDYISATGDVKEDLMMVYSMELMSELKMCIADKHAVVNIMKEKHRATEQMNRDSKEKK